MDDITKASQTYLCEIISSLIISKVYVRSVTSRLSFSDVKAEIDKHIQDFAPSHSDKKQINSIIQQSSFYQSKIVTPCVESFLFS